MALLAAPGQFDPGVTHQTIRHLRQQRGRHAVRFAQAPMASLACIVGIQIPPHVARRRQIDVVVNRTRDERRDVPHLQMQRMAERRDRDSGRSRNRRTLVTIEAHRFRRQNIIRNPGAGRRRSMTPRASKVHLQVQPMRKGRGVSYCRRAHQYQTPQEAQSLLASVA